MATGGANELGGISERALDRASVFVAAVPRRSQLDELQQPAATCLLPHGVRRRPVGGRHRLDAEPGDRQSARLVRQDAQSPGGPYDSLWRVVLVPVFHPGPCDVGVHYRSATESELYVRRGERWLLERSSDLWRGDGLSDRRLVGRLAVHYQACQAGAQGGPNPDRP